MSLSVAIRMLLLAMVMSGWGVAAASFGRMDPFAPDKFRIQRTIQLGFEITNTSRRLLKGIEIGVSLPVREAAGQYCCVNLNSSLPGEIVGDTHGNQALLVRIAHLAPHATKTLSIRVVVATAPAEASSPQPNDVLWLRSEAFIEADHPRILELAQVLDVSLPHAPIVTARRIHDWVASHIRYEGYRSQARGALYALEKKQGDCTEYTQLVVALARASGIPARVMAGYVIERDGLVPAEAYHNWAEVYVDGAWRIIDAQRQQFDTGYGQYIATSIVGVESAIAPDNAQRFWASEEAIRLKMQ